MNSYLDMALTETELRMFNVLKDGKPHTAEELHMCLNDELQPMSRVAVYVTYLRRKLACNDLAIISDRRDGKKTQYRLVRFL